MNSQRKTVSLVLGSGGARGLAHIGVIQVLEERGYDIRSISGSSMGALIGGIYAAGKLDIYSNWVCALDRLDVLRLLDVSFSGTAIFKGEKIINTLQDLIGQQNIEDLPIAFTAVATDLEESKEVWLSSGPLCEAIRASIAFPTVFSAVPYQGKTLVDGGLLNPIPIAPTLRDLTDITIAVSLKRSPRHRKFRKNVIPIIRKYLILLTIYIVKKMVKKTMLAFLILSQKAWMSCSQQLPASSSLIIGLIF